MKCLVNRWVRLHVWVLACMLGGGLALSSCGDLLEKLLEEPEYPDEDFSIVGTWQYHTEPYADQLWGSENYVGDVDGYITFTADGKFCYTLETADGPIKGYGTYEYNDYEPETSNSLMLYYNGWLDVRDLLEPYCYRGYPSNNDPHSNFIQWGYPGDRVEDDYILVDRVRVKEYRRVETRPYEEVSMPGPRLPERSDKSDTWQFVYHDGSEAITFNDKGAKALEEWNASHSAN